MRTLISFLLVLGTSGTFAQKAILPPPAPSETVKDTFWGVTIEDPYNNLEDLSDPEVIGWMKAHTSYAETVIGSVANLDHFKEDLKVCVEKSIPLIYSLRITRDGKYLYVRDQFNGLPGKLFYRESYQAENKLLFDPAGYKSETGLQYQIGNISVDHDSEKVAIKLAPNGSEMWDVIVVDLQGNILEQSVKSATNVGVSWLPGGTHYLYNRYRSDDEKDPDLKKFTKTFIHKLGTSQEEDLELFSNTTNPELGIEENQFPIAYYDRDIKAIIGIVANVDKSISLYLKEGDLMTPSSWKTLASAADEVEDFGVSKDRVYYKTYKNTPKFKILAAGFDHPEITSANTVVESFEDKVIEDFTFTSEGLYFTTLKNGIEAELWVVQESEGEPRKIALPVSAGNIGMRIQDPNKPDIWISMSGWTTPPKRYRFELNSGKFTYEPIIKGEAIPGLDELMVEEVLVTSHDGVKVPLSIIYHKDLKREGTNPTILSGYGAYGSVQNPSFNPMAAVLCPQGVVMAIAHVRGGGELGDEWHRAGQKLNKPNTWKDAIACAEYLIDEAFTNPGHLGLIGGSAGGILVGRAITDRPDLFRAAAPLVGVMNPVTAEFTPNGSVNIPEFGTVKDEDEFKGLMEMDSYLHLKKGVSYPATYITAGINDPRVIAWQPAKFAAKMMEDNASEHPILFHTDFEGGHGGGATLSHTLENVTRTYGFLLWQTGHPEYQQKPELNED